MFGSIESYKSQGINSQQQEKQQRTTAFRIYICTYMTYREMLTAKTRRHTLVFGHSKLHTSRGLMAKREHMEVASPRLEV